MFRKSHTAMLSSLILLAGALVSAPALRAQQEQGTEIDVESYVIDAEVNPRTQDIEAVVTVRFQAMQNEARFLRFELHNDLKLNEVTDEKDNDVPTSRSFDDFSVRVTLPEPMSQGESKELRFSYAGRLTGREESPVWGIRFAAIHSDHAYLLYPARWFPVSGYTTDRFTAELNITVPSGYKVLASGLETKDESTPDKGTYTFRFSQPSFPGSIAIVQGEPQKVSSEGVITTIYFRDDKAALAGTWGKEVGSIMAFLSGVFGIAPQSSLTVVQTEDGTPSGFSAPGMLFLSSNTIEDEVNSRLLVNQISRQWWGTLCSVKSRNHLWVINGMARFAEMLWLEETEGPSAAEQEMRDNYVEALTVDNVPLIQAARLEDYSPEFWASTAGKGTAILNMLRLVMGEDGFARLLKAFPEQYAWKDFYTADFRKVAEEISGRSLQGFFIQWIESSGAPEFDIEYTVFRTRQGFRIMGKITQDLDTFRMPVQLKIETEGNPEEKEVEVVGPSTDFIVETFGKPKNVIVDPNSKVLRFSDSVRVSVAIRRGEQFAEIGEFVEALKEYQKALDVNRYSSLAHYRIAEVFFLQRNYQSAANEFREALNGDLEPSWTEVWSHINLGMIFDITGQRERAVNEYNLALRTKDNTQGAQEKAAFYLQQPYERARQTI